MPNRVCIPSEIPKMIAVGVFCCHLAACVLGVKSCVLRQFGADFANMPVMATELHKERDVWGSGAGKYIT